MAQFVEIKADLQVSDTGEISGMAWPWGIPDLVKGMSPLILREGQTQVDSISLHHHITNLNDGYRVSRSFSFSDNRQNTHKAIPSPLQLCAHRCRMNKHLSLVNVHFTHSDPVFSQKRLNDEGLFQLLFIPVMLKLRPNHGLYRHCT